MATMTIPLECKICLKKPDFSDVSHLLTHIASKAHLSRYYQMKVKGSTDGSSRNSVDDYDDWYERYNIDELMRDRLNQKEKRNGGRAGSVAPARRASAGQSKRRKRKKTVPKADVTPSEATTASSRSTPAPTGNGNARRGPRPLRDSVLNPQLDARVKIEPMSRSGTPVSALSLDPAAFHLHTRYAPPSWPTTPYADSPMKQETLSSSRSDDDDDSFVPGPQSRSTQGRARRNASGSGTTVYSGVDEEEDAIGETTSDVAKLKGLVWPGMAMFDSATPDMRRKRNQKKDYSVIEHLMATSEYTEPTEMIFDAAGVKRRERVITGNPDMDEDDSLLSGEVEPEPELPKKRPARKPRQALVEKDRNTGRITRRRAGGSHHPPFGKNKRPYYGDATGDDDDLTYGAPRPRKRNGPSIHRDNSGPDITFEQPTPLSVLASSFRNPFQQAPRAGVQHAQPLYAQGSTNRGHNRLPSFTFGGNAYGNDTFRPTSTAGNFSMPNYASFGGLNSQTLFQHNPYSTSNGTSALAAFQQQFGRGSQQPYVANTGLYPTHAQSNHHHHHQQGSWDLLAGLGQDLGLPNGGADHHGFAAGTELNPLFFSSNQAAPPEDDEGTISAPGSDRER